MYFLNEMCCICMNKSDLKNIFAADNDGVSHYKKLTLSIPEMKFKEMNNQRLICGECCVNLNTVYNFRQKCLRNKANLINYLSQLQTYSKVSGILSVRLTKLVSEIIVVKKEIEIECGNEGIVKENYQQHEFKTESFEDSIHSPASVNEEWESEEDDSSAHEDITNDQMIENVKIEKVELQTMVEDEDYAEYTEIDIKEDPLTDMKVVPMSVIETSQDGSTSQADVRTFREPKEREGTAVGSEHTLDMQKIDEGPHKCEICYEAFILEKYLVKHMKFHSSERPYECEICKKRFKSKKYCSNHMKIHTSERPYECEICKKTFPLKYYLGLHMRVHSVERRHECEICNKTFIYKGTLNQHMKIHSGERTFECEICNKNFSNTGNLNLHMRKHSGKRPYECPICHKNFYHKSHLNEHSKNHGERTFECEICKKGYQTQRYLDAHMKKHSAERKYECELCKKFFVCKVSFNKHMRIHGERPYECEICHKSFYHKGHLNAHLKIHSERCFECEICKKVYTMQRYLDIHMKKHSGEPKICEIFIKEEPTEVKEEPMSDTETTQDGSTSQAYA